MTDWKRREYTTPGVDPTVVVEWYNSVVQIKEFRGVFSVHYGDRELGVDEVDDIWVALHKALEHCFHLEEQLNEINKDNTTCYDEVDGISRY